MQERHSNLQIISIAYIYMYINMSVYMHIYAVIYKLYMLASYIHRNLDTHVILLI